MFHKGGAAPRARGVGGGRHAQPGTQNGGGNVKHLTFVSDTQTNNY